nr:CheR family methyltransferase [Citreimonas salinaria]
MRDIVVFAPHNLLRDPPFSRLDLVSCRNFLIYLEPDAQKKIIALCHFALRQGGHLFLGNAETVGRHDDLFETVSKKWRIYRRSGTTRHDLIDYPPPRNQPAPRSAERLSPQAPEQNVSAAALARHALLDHFAPASVLIDRKGRVLYFHGTTRDYLEKPARRTDAGSADLGPRRTGRQVARRNPRSVEEKGERDGRRPHPRGQDRPASDNDCDAPACVGEGRAASGHLRPGGAAA